jgi:DNA-binding transcriptional regulator YiaG
MPARKQPEVALLVRETCQRLELAQVNFAARLGVYFQSVNRCRNRYTKPLSLALKHIQELLHQLSDRSKDLLANYFPE